MNAHETNVGDIGQIAITVGDVAAARAFYCDVLGLRFLFNASEPRVRGGRGDPRDADDRAGARHGGTELDALFPRPRHRGGLCLDLRARCEGRARTGADGAHAGSRALARVRTRSRRQPRRAHGRATPALTITRRSTHMIARLWHGRIRSGDAERYYRYIENTGLRDYARTQGNRGVSTSSVARGTSRTSSRCRSGNRSMRSSALRATITSVRGTTRRTMRFCSSARPRSGTTTYATQSRGRPTTRTHRIPREGAFRLHGQLCRSPTVEVLGAVREVARARPRNRIDPLARTIVTSADHRSAYGGRGRAPRHHLSGQRPPAGRGRGLLRAST